MPVIIIIITIIIVDIITTVTLSGGCELKSLDRSR